MGIKRIRVVVGDVFEVIIGSDEKKYFQYIADDHLQLNSRTIRVFEKKYKISENPSIESIVQQDVEYFFHTSIQPGYKGGYWTKIGNSRDIGDISGIKFYLPDRDIIRWNIWEINKRRKKRRSLPKSYSRASLGYLFSPSTIVKMMTFGQFCIHPSFWSLPDKNGNYPSDPPF